MRIFILMIMLATGIASTSAQSVSNRLNPFSTKKGDAYFIGNKKLSERSKDIKRFVFDMTYVSHCDSLTMNFTVVSPNREDISRLSVSNGTFTTEASDVKLLYHETKGSNFVVRTTAQVSYKDIKKLYTSDTPVVFTFTDTEGRTNTATYSTGDWKKEKAVFEKIFYTINI